MKNQHTIIFIDPDGMSRQKLKKEIEKSSAVRLVGETDNLTDGFQLINKHRPEIVFLDIDYSVDHALASAEKITQNFPEVAFLI